jgi:hypothetical protein
VIHQPAKDIAKGFSFHRVTTLDLSITQPGSI